MNNAFKVGDKVVVVGRSNITGILSDNMLELADGSDVPNQAKLEDALYNNQPLTVSGTEPFGFGGRDDMGYILSLGDKELYGLHEADKLKLA